MFVSTRYHQINRTTDEQIPFSFLLDCTNINFICSQPKGPDFGLEIIQEPILTAAIHNNFPIDVLLFVLVCTDNKMPQSQPKGFLQV